MRKMDSGAPLWPRGPWLLLLLWSAALATSASSGADHTSVQAEPRANVLLQCEAPEGTDLKNLVLEWTRSDLKQSYVFLFRDGRPLLFDQHRHFKSRVELIDPTLRSGDLSIVLLDVGQTDSGKYTCHVFSHAHARKRSVLGTKPVRTVELTVGPERLSVQAQPRTDVTLPCEAPEGSDLNNLALEWTRSDLKQDYMFLFKDGRPLLSRQHPHFRDRVELIDPTLRSGNLSIVLHHVGKTDNGNYTCHVFSQSRIRKRSVLDTHPIRAIELRVTGGALRSEAGVGLMAAVLVSLFLQI